MASEIDALMDLDPLSLTAENIDEIIAYHRKARAGGPKPKKDSGPKLDISALVQGMTESAPSVAGKIRRR